MSDDLLRAALRERIDQLELPEVIVVDRLVSALLTPVQCTLAAGSWLTATPWAKAFLARLRAHHALNAEPLSTTAFEAAFNGACEAAGWKVAPAGSATNRFFDTVVALPSGEQRSLSLKATAAKGLRADSLHISKLTEAAWIQDARTQAGRRDKLVALFAEYRRQTDAILVLRCFREGSDAYRYELVEVPTALFASVDELGVAEAQLATIPIPTGQDPPDARLRIDRSDAKITVTGIRLDRCLVHGSWTIPNRSGVARA
ncbi:MAG TPA: hypothetical protein VNF07_04960 [Acidimicrobiales bacterium]|nr:hypothetical protein [Acidimicrobiales bacterium]